MDCGCWRDHSGRVETIVVTENHPYLRADGTVDLLRAVALEPRGAFDELQQSRWTGAGFLQAGDTLQSALTRSAPGTLTVVSSEVVLAPTPVYNFEVAGDHTYAVGQLAAWVHNARSRTSGETGAAARGRAAHASYQPPGTQGVNTSIPGAGRADAIDPCKCIVYELKPNNPRAVSRGGRQLARYIDGLNRSGLFSNCAGKWTGKVETY